MHLHFHMPAVHLRVDFIFISSFIVSFPLTVLLWKGISHVSMSQENNNANQNNKGKSHNTQGKEGTEKNDHGPLSKFLNREHN